MQATEKETVKSADALTDWMFQDAVGVYKNSSKWACVARYFVNPAFRIVVQFRFLQWIKQLEHADKSKIQIIVSPLRILPLQQENEGAVQ